MPHAPSIRIISGLYLSRGGYSTGLLLSTFSASGGFDFGGSRLGISEKKDSIGQRGHLSER